MSVATPDNSDDVKTVNGSKSDHLNGLQNGYSSSEKHKSSHKSSSKDKHRDKDRDHKSSSSKHGSSSSSSNRDKDRHSSGKSSSSHKSSNRDKERSDKERSDKDRSDKSRSDKDKVRSDKDKERSSDKSKSGEGSRDKDKSDKHRSSSSSLKHSSSSSSKDHKSSSSSSSRDKSSSSSSKDKERSDKDKHRSDRDKHHSSSSSRDKSSSNGTSRDKDKHSSKEKSSHSLSKDKSSSSTDSKDVFKSPLKVESIKVASPVVKKEESSWVDEDPEEQDQDPLADAPNVTASSCDYSLSQFKEEPLDDKMDESEEDIPLSARKNNKRKSFESDEESEEEKPLSARKVIKTEKKPKLKKEPLSDEDDDYSDEDVKPAKKKIKAKPKAKVTQKQKPSASTTTTSPTKKKKKAEEEQEVWKWWEEEKKDDGTKWKFLEHKGPLFAPAYERLPKNVVFRYDGKEVPLSEESEEVAGFYAKMLDHDYTSKKVFNDNFFNDWRKTMTDKEKAIIKDLKKCDFKTMHAFFTAQSEKNRNKSKEEKAGLKAKNEEIMKEYGFCTIDGHKEKIGNFRIEPPGLFRGRGEHPKMGKHKKRVEPQHVMINCSKDSEIPKPPPGHKWKEVRHDNTVTWLASWTENVQGQVKYVMLNPSSKLKGEKDWQKYETARTLAKSIDKIRNTYREEWKAKEMRIRQRAVALYFIDKLALRAGNEKDEDQADTVGCCSLRVEHIELHKQKDDKEYLVVFDFLGKDSIRYYNEVEVEKRVFKNLELFKENKKEGDDLFDRLNTQTMNEHLRDLMPNLTAKVFRTFNASFTLQNQLRELTKKDDSIEEKILSYNRANRAVAILCNHQRAVPKGHQKSMEALKDKIQAKEDLVYEAEKELKELSRAKHVKDKLTADKKKKALQRLKEQLKKLQLQETDRDENKTIALGTSKLNYLDPRISIAWCKKFDVPIEKIYNKTQRDKFRWAIDMATEDYVF